MRLTYPTIAVAAATFAATLALAPVLVNAAQHLDLSQFLTMPAHEAPVTTVTQEAPNCASALGLLADALGDKDCG